MAVIFRRESCLAHFAQKLTFGTVVFVKIYFRRIATRTCTVIADVTFGTTPYRLDWLIAVTVTPSEVLHEIPVIPRLCIENYRKLINFVFLIFW
jgi:hypothetical protein